MFHFWFEHDHNFHCSKASGSSASSIWDSLNTLNRGANTSMYSHHCTLPPRGTILGITLLPQPLPVNNILGNISPYKFENHSTPCFSMAGLIFPAWKHHYFWKNFDSSQNNSKNASGWVLMAAWLVYVLSQGAKTRDWTWKSDSVTSLLSNSILNFLCVYCCAHRFSIVSVLLKN